MIDYRTLDKTVHHMISGINTQQLRITQGDVVTMARFDGGVLSTAVVTGLVQGVQGTHCFPIYDQRWDLVISEREPSEIPAEDVELTHIYNDDSTTWSALTINGTKVIYPAETEMTYAGTVGSNLGEYALWIGWGSGYRHQQIRRVGFNVDMDSCRYHIIDSFSGDTIYDSLDHLKNAYPYIWTTYGPFLVHLWAQCTKVSESHVEPEPVEILDRDQAMAYLTEYYNHPGWSDSDMANTPEAMLVAWRAECAGQWLHEHGENTPTWDQPAPIQQVGIHPASPEFIAQMQELPQPWDGKTIATGELAEIIKRGEEMRERLGDHIEVDVPDLDAQHMIMRSAVRSNDNLAGRHHLLAQVFDERNEAIEYYNARYDNDAYLAARHEGDTEYNNRLISYALALCGHSGYAIDDMWLAGVDPEAVSWFALFVD